MSVRRVCRALRLWDKSPNTCSSCPGGTRRLDGAGAGYQSEQITCSRERSAHVLRAKKASSILDNPFRNLYSGFLDQQLAVKVVGHSCLQGRSAHACSQPISKKETSL